VHSMLCRPGCGVIQMRVCAHGNGVPALGVHGVHEHGQSAATGLAHGWLGRRPHIGCRGGVERDLSVRQQLLACLLRLGLIWVCTGWHSKRMEGGRGRVGEGLAGGVLWLLLGSCESLFGGLGQWW
jgi:hypothetical protein